MLSIDNCKPFDVLNLGKYERQYWQGVTFGNRKGKSLTEQALYEYLAFILKLYGAQPVAGMAQLHGKKGKAMVHIGSVAAPVTIAEIDAAVDECAKLKQGQLHVLGWEWEMGLYRNQDRGRSWRCRSPRCPATAGLLEKIHRLFVQYEDRHEDQASRFAARSGTR